MSHLSCALAVHLRILTKYRISSLPPVESRVEKNSQPTAATSSTAHSPPPQDSSKLGKAMTLVVPVRFECSVVLSLVGTATTAGWWVSEVGG